MLVLIAEIVVIAPHPGALAMVATGLWMAWPGVSLVRAVFGSGDCANVGLADRAGPRIWHQRLRRFHPLGCRHPELAGDCVRAGVDLDPGGNGSPLGGAFYWPSHGSMAVTSLRSRFCCSSCRS